jgi:hypothetical protein
MTKDEMVALLKEEVKGLTSALTDPTDYDNASSDASREIGWSFPVVGDFKIYWMKYRAKRHLYFYLVSESAHKFKVKQFSLDHRFKHYKALIEMMDAEFVAIQEERPDEFAGVDEYELFGTKVDAGFAYDQTGKDITYDADQEVIHQPDEG